jgi:two-component system LytT family response regulator
MNEIQQTTPLRVLIVDDEAPARRKLLRFLRQSGHRFEITEAGSGAEALELLKKNCFDLLFLDIQMPGMDGFSVLAEIDPETLPALIFSTAFDQYAVRAFDLMAVDYLLKPYPYERFIQALERAIKQTRSPGETHPNGILQGLLNSGTSAPVRNKDLFFFRENHRIYPIPHEDIRFLEADGNYTQVNTSTRTFLERRSLKQFESELDPTRFCRIHRSTIVNRHRITELQALTHGDYAVILDDRSRHTLSRRFTAAFGL